MQLELFETLSKITEEKLHPKYKLLRDNHTMTGAKKILLEWSEGFVDRDNKIIKEFQTSYHSAFWELYVYAVLKEIGDVDMSHQRPDFLAKIKACSEFYVEATTANIKEGGEQECNREAYDIYKILFEPVFLRSDFDEVVREAVIRHANALIVKNKKYENEYRNLPHVNDNQPFVIALGAFDQIDYGQESFYPMIALLYKQFYNPQNGSYYHKEVILKDNAAPIDLGLFCDEKFKHISAIMFSCIVTHGKLCALAKSKGFLSFQQILNIRHDIDFPHFKLQETSNEVQETLMEGLYIFHNPFAKNPLPWQIFQKTDAIQVRVQDEGLWFEGNRLPIIARCSSMIPLPLNLIEPLMYQAYNPGYDFGHFHVVEIDERMVPMEITLIAENGHYSRIIELTRNDVIEIKNKAIKEGDLVSADIDSRNPNCVKLLRIEKIPSQE